jgi:hypothetical protein
MGKSKNHTGEDGGSLTPEDDGGGGEAERREKWDERETEQLLIIKW